MIRVVTIRLWLVLALVGATVAVLLLRPPSPVTQQWIVSGSSPWIVGTPSDPFAYDGVHSARGDGTLVLTLDTASGRGQLEAVAHPVGHRTIQLLSSLQTGSSVAVRSDTLQLETADGFIYGDSGLWGPELPLTRARIAGSGSFEVRLDDTPVGDGLHGRWSLAAAVRRQDGSIRSGGLLYSPVLRDKTGFSSRDSLEVILIITTVDANEAEAAELHLVFTDVRIEASPGDSAP